MLLLIAQDERKVRIEVGYGLEGALPDAIAANIIQTRILPAFKRGDMVAGVVAGSQAIMQALAGEYKPVDNASKDKLGGPWLFILMVIVMIVLHNLRGGGGGGRVAGAAPLTSPVASVPVAPVAVLVVAAAVSVEGRQFRRRRCLRWLVTGIKRRHMISKQFFHTLQARVKQAEQATDAELVTVLAPPATAIATYPPCGRRCWPCSPRCWYSSSVSGSAGTRSCWCSGRSGWC